MSDQLDEGKSLKERLIERRVEATIEGDAFSGYHCTSFKILDEEERISAPIQAAEAEEAQK